ncbi:DUF3169 family protein [Staphylococcus piscifermentans]|nr:DUF3169 family protein [Staphylococcus piscifermentans]
MIMSKVKRNIHSLFKIVLFALAGFIVGYSVMYFGKNDYPRIINSQGTIVSTIFTTAIITAIGALMISKINNAEKFKIKIENGDIYADKYDFLFNKNIYNASLLVYISIFFSLINIIVITLFQSTFNNVWFITIIPFLICIYLSSRYTRKITKIDDRLPKYNDPEYTNKLINAMDEGEKHCTYEALFKIYRYNISILMMLIIILAACSIITGANMAIALFSLLALYVFNITFYYVKIGKYFNQ